MKLKTQEEIKEITMKGIRISDLGTMTKLESASFCYNNGYSQAQSDLVEQASEGFDDFFCRYANESNLHHEFDAYEFWQASQLSHAKKDQEKDKLIEKLRNEISELKGKLKTENHYKFTECDCPAGINCECED